MRFTRISESYGSNYCWTDGYRENGCSLALLSLFGHRNMVSAISAHLSKGGSVTTKIGGKVRTHSIDKDASYARVKSALKDDHGRSMPDMLHQIIVDRNATAQASAWEPTYIQLAETEEEAKEVWLKRFARRCRVPVVEHWGSTLWDKGIAANKIHVLRGFGLGAWWISTETEAWHKVVSTAVREGELTT